MPEPIPEPPPFWRDPRFIGFAVTLVSSAIKRWGGELSENLNNEVTWVLTAIFTYLLGPGLVILGQILSRKRSVQTATALRSQGVYLPPSQRAATAPKR